jgi:hypothetical protein
MGSGNLFAGCTDREHLVRQLLMVGMDHFCQLLTY